MVSIGGEPRLFTQRKSTGEFALRYDCFFVAGLKTPWSVESSKNLRGADRTTLVPKPCGWEISGLVFLDDSAQVDWVWLLPGAFAGLDCFEQFVVAAARGIQFAYPAALAIHGKRAYWKRYVVFFEGTGQVGVLRGRKILDV